MLYYNKDPKRDPNFDNHQCRLEDLVQSAGLQRLGAWHSAWFRALGFRVSEPQVRLIPGSPSPTKHLL